MLKQVVLVLSLHLGMLVTATAYFHSTMKPCPSFESKSNFGINKVCYTQCKSYIINIYIYICTDTVAIAQLTRVILQLAGSAVE